MASGSFLMDMQCGDVPATYSTDIACSVLDAIDAAGEAGADMGSLAFRTHYDASLLSRALRDLQNAGMAWSSAEGRYRVTGRGETMRRIARY